MKIHRDDKLLNNLINQTPMSVFNAELMPEGASWYCLHTKSKREKVVAKSCYGLKIPFFLPLRKSIKRHGGRNYTFDVPLFKGYMFCAATLDNRYDLMATNHLVRTIEVADERDLLQDLRRIAFALEREAPLQPFDFLKRGQVVRISGGPFQGVEGIVSRRQGKYRVVLNVKLIHMAVALEVDVEHLKPVE